MLRLLVLAIVLAGCAPPPEATGNVQPDNTTPQGAIQVLESAYGNRDLEAAVRAKDFRLEAQLMLEKLNPEFASDEELIASTADTLELAYRAQIEGQGFPDMTGLTTSFLSVEPVREGIVIVTEETVFPDTARLTQRILVGKTRDGWKVLNVVE